MRIPPIRQKSLLFAAVLLALLSVGVAIWYISGLDIAVLDPKGIIASKERSLLIFTTLLGLTVVIPVFVMTIAIAWRYRESNTSAAYTPKVSTNRLAETIWWGIPIILIVILSVVTWTSTHDLDPHKPLDSTVEPVKIQVVALDWKWLFIYPDYNIASVNFIQIPTDTPISFSITADAPMNSFWIPQLSGQIYAMPGMSTQLHLNATEAGEYRGSSSNISGEGFSGMKFTTKATDRAKFDAWVAAVKQSSTALSTSEYASLREKSKNNPATFYAPVTDELYDTIIMKYMMPESHSSDHHSHTDMETH